MRIRTALLTAVTTLALTGGATAHAAPVPAGTAPAAAAAAGPLQPVPSLDLPRYLGRWYQVAAIPQPFTLQCWSRTQATYTAVDADTVGVRNECTTLLGRVSSVTGTADVLDRTTNAQLRVTFRGVPPVGDPARPNYVVSHIAPDYSWALVGDPDRRSGFVLSRSGALTPAQWAQVKQVVAEDGYAPTRFWTTPQDGGEKLPRRLDKVA